MHCLPLKRSPDERTYSLAVIIYDRLAEIIIEVSFSHLRATESADSTAVCHRDGSIRIFLDEAVDELRIETHNIFCMRIINVTTSESLKEGICEHDRACRLLIISFSLRTIENLIPHSCLLVRPLRKDFKEIIQLLYQSPVARMGLRKIVENLHKSDCIPTCCASPRVR